jgi:hypothetical protein
MWALDSRWFDVAAFTTVCVVLTVVFGRFERHKPAWRRLGKIVALVAIALVLIEGLGRTWAYAIFGLLLLAGAALHFVVLSKLGINGFTGKPRHKFEALLHEIETHGERRTLLKVATSRRRSSP